MNDALFRLEFTRLVRQPLTWAVFGILFAAMLVGGFAGAARVAEERASIARAMEEMRASIAAAKATSARYAEPAPYEVAQFRDPSDAYGYMYNFLTSYATRAPAPLASLAVGQSELRPSRIRVNFADPFPDTAQELRSPRILALGAFDLAFVLVYLLPLAVIAIGGQVLTQEQDSGVLRMIAAQPVSPARVAGAKFGALAVLTVPAAAAGALLALLLVGGVGSGVTALSLLVVALLAAAYAALWVAACALAASLWRGAVAALMALVLTWAAFTVLLPTLAALLLDVALPAPSRLAYVEASRNASDRIGADKLLPARWLAGRPDLASVDARTESSPEVARMAAQDMLRRALAPYRWRIDDHATALEGSAAMLRLVSPALVLDDALQRLAGSDEGAQRAFLAAADAYGQRLRRWFEPRVIATIGTAKACPTCPGRGNFAAYDAVPTFAAPASLPASAWPAALYLCGLATLAGLMAARRLRTWPL